MPFIGPCAAERNAAFTDSTVAGFCVVTVRSTTLTFGVGTRMEYPSSLPFNSGTTRCKAFAAPVDVGIIEIAAARARRKSLWGRSSSLWSFVYEWIVVIVPCTIPKVSFKTLATGARQFVVHDAFETTLC